MSKKRKLEVTKDVWTLISRQCEWPELSALRMVCTAARDTISLQSVHDKYKKWNTKTMGLYWGVDGWVYGTLNIRMGTSNDMNGLGKMIRHNKFEAIGYTCIYRLVHHTTTIK